MDALKPPVPKVLLQQGNPQDFRQKPMPSVEVLLSAWNGGSHIEEQLHSLVAQEGVFHLHIRIRDDGSTDDTVSRINTFMKSHEMDAGCSGSSDSLRALSLTCGENLGFVRSFFTLLAGPEEERSSPEETSTADYYAFCDQDDVWLPDKLARAISWLQAEEEKWAFAEEEKRARAEGMQHPMICCSRLALVNADLQPIGMTRPVRRPPAFANALVENIVTGATLVMNRAARNLVLEGFQGASFAWEDILLHDWWCYLVVSAFGTVLYDPEPRILYRQHGKNQVGQPAGFLARQIKRWKRFSRSGNVRGISRQATLFLSLYAEKFPRMKTADRERLSAFVARHHNGFSRVAHALHPDVWRQSRFDSLLLRLLLLMDRI